MSQSNQNQPDPANQLQTLLDQLNQPKTTEPGQPKDWKERTLRDHLRSFMLKNTLDTAVNAGHQQESLRKVKAANARGESIQQARDEMAANSLGANLSRPAVEQDADEMRIQFDSPSTTNNINVPPELLGGAKKAGMSFGKKMLAAGLIGAAGVALPGVGALGAYAAIKHLGLLKPASETIIKEESRPREIEVELLGEDGEWRVIDAIDVTNED